MFVIYKPNTYWTKNKVQAIEERTHTEDGFSDKIVGLVIYGDAEIEEMPYV